MDNIAHTLAGLALADAGLKRRTALGTATLAIGANLPDVDVLAYLFGDGLDALVFRRGWTHGVLAMAVLPVLLAALMLAWDRGVLRRRQATWRGLLLVAAIGIWSHPLLDLMNVYGVRLLMPFSDRWFYGDTLFIVDPFLWLALGTGIVLARRRERRQARTVGARAGGSHAARPARLALAVLAAYVAAMALASAAGRATLRREVAGGATRVMASPVPVTPLGRETVSEIDGGYELGTLAFGRGWRYTPERRVPSGRDSPSAIAAARTREGAAFLSWSRFPRFVDDTGGAGRRVRISDLRYADERGRGWASVVVELPAPPDEP